MYRRILRIGKRRQKGQAPGDFLLILPRLPEIKIKGKEKAPLFSTDFRKQLPGNPKIKIRNF